MKQKELEPIVKLALEKYRVLREDDFQLWIYVANQFYNGTIYEEKILKVMLKAQELGLPAFESVTRCRRKLQAKYPNLCNEQTRQARAKKEEEYEEYSRS